MDVQTTDGTGDLDASGTPVTPAGWVILLTDVVVEKPKADGRKRVEVWEVVILAANGTVNCPSARNPLKAGETELVIAWKNPEPTELLRAGRTFTKGGSSGHFLLFIFIYKRTRCSLCR